MIIRPIGSLTLTGKLTFTYRLPSYKDGNIYETSSYTKIVRVSTYENLIVTTGKIAVARGLAGDLSVANPGEITFAAVGTGTNAPAISDTTLQTEFFRKILSLRSFSANKAILQMFMTTAEGNANLREFGLFGEAASATPDSGTLFNRVNITEDKTSATTLTIEAEITVG